MELAGTVSSQEQEEDVKLILSSVAKQFAQSSILFPLCLLWWRATDIFWTLSQHTEKPGISEVKYS
ncbi:hypothetical protein DPMN_193656 [Dreissena polymorpha]|uniref:Uncharacterized protein n=1 Tax=Dreissena polymorpha TaxID=45954 RepID=A0A9D3Y111_DREPO|nr:hypothetical protein DPMN_193656 [Dreissena polymorpha]